MRIYLLVMLCVSQVCCVQVLGSEVRMVDMSDNFISTHNVNTKQSNNMDELMELLTKGVVIDDSQIFDQSDEKENTLDNGLGGVLESYLKPISKLSELFPNQQVEVQLEIDGSNYRGTAPKRYNLRQNPRQNESTGVETSGVPTSTPANAVVKVMNIEATTTSDPKDRPVYMSDLKKVLEDYEKKHLPQFQENIKSVPHVNIRQNVGTLNEILKILKKGVHIEPDVGKPTEDGMSWFQIKIPRN